MSVHKVIKSSAARRLAFVVAWLALLDPFVARVLPRLEHARYESTAPFRFEASDLFGIGPTVAYLRDVPVGDRPRTVFFGNSVIFGYGLKMEDAVPYAFQRLVPDVRVFNLAINSLETGSSYLIAKQIVGSVDAMYVLLSGEKVESKLVGVIPIDSSDLARFGLPAPKPLEATLQRSLGFWHLYRNSYRIQNALVGGSTRMFLYRNKAEWARGVKRLMSGQTAPLSPMADDPRQWPPTTVSLRTPVAATPPTRERLQRYSQRHPVLWSFADLAAAHHKRAVFLDFVDLWEPLPDEEAADFNRHFGPRVSVVQIAVPAALRFDRLHMTPDGARQVAQALFEWQADPRVSRDLH